MSEPDGRPVLRLVARPVDLPPANERPAGRQYVVLDTTWTPGPGETAIGVRGPAREVLHERDLIEETASRLDDWAEATGVAEAMACEGTSYWYYIRLRHWMWLQQQTLWLGMLDRLVSGVRPAAIEGGPGLDEHAQVAARRLAERDGLPVALEDDGPSAAHAAEAPAAPVPTTPSSPPPPAGAPIPPTLGQRLDAVRLRLTGRLGVTDPRARREVVIRRLRRLSRESGRLLVVLEHARQRVETPDGPRFLNPYLGPIVERLRGTRLDPIEIDIRARVLEDAGWQRVNEWRSARLLPIDAVALAAKGSPKVDDQADVDRRADAIEATTVPLVVSGVDLGPGLRTRVADEARRSLAGQFRGARSTRLLLRELRPSGILLADEYHRQTWLAAAAAEGVPTIAVQHGMIYRWHNGYMHRRRPAELRLANRTYVFGRWERELLTTASVYREDEVRVGGSPRLDLVRPEPVDRDAVRAELGVEPGRRLVVLSGTWGPIYRRFHYPTELASLFDRALPNVHLVVKLHPGEQDQGPYRAVIEGVAAAGGFVPPAITVVQAVDLYRLLSAADAHIGIHSTVLTEAVWIGTPNLLAAGLAGADLLGYVEAGVAHPVRNGGDLLEALEHGYGVATPEARRAFLEAHFEPGNASQRIADDLLAWL